MADMLAGLQWKICLVYLDDIVVYGWTLEECQSRLQLVFDCLRSYGLKLKASKCKLFRKETQSLGHVISADGIKADPEKLSVVAKWPTPRDMKEVRSFLGFASYYRDFIEGFVGLAEPLQ